MSEVSSHAREVEAGGRFEFGANWTRFLKLLDERRIQGAEQSLREFLGADRLEGKTFLDAGCGSGLFSLAAYRLGARVYSFDFDPKSVACARELRSRYGGSDPAWVIAEGSVLDPVYLEGLGQFDIVYSWGVLHHTGAMWDALANVAPRVKPGGQLFIAIYNDQGTWSKRWHRIKRLYNRTPRGLRFGVLFPSLLIEWGPRFLKDFLTFRPFRQWREYGRERGMSAWVDHVDWVGGFPFEVAKPEEIFQFYRKLGFTLENLQTAAGTVGCNQFVFRKTAI